MMSQYVSTLPDVFDLSCGAGVNEFFSTSAVAQTNIWSQRLLVAKFASARCSIKRDHIRDDRVYKRFRVGGSRSWMYFNKVVNEFRVEFVVDISNVKNSKRLPNENDLRDCDPNCIVVVSYRFIEGDHVPFFATHLVDILQQIVDLHKEEIVHGDIRLFNCLFNNQGGHLIDLDFAGTNNISKYPFGYSKDISDGGRHSGAVGGTKMCFSHDIYSFLKIWDLFTVEDCYYEEDWFDMRSALVEYSKIDFTEKSATELVEKLRQKSGGIAISLADKKLIELLGVGTGQS